MWFVPNGVPYSRGHKQYERGRFKRGQVLKERFFRLKILALPINLCLSAIIALKKARSSPFFLAPQTKLYEDHPTPHEP